MKSIFALLTLFAIVHSCFGIVCKKCDPGKCQGSSSDETCKTSDAMCGVFYGKPGGPIVAKRCAESDKWCNLPGMKCCYGDRCNNNFPATTSCDVCTDCYGTGVTPTQAVCAKHCYSRLLADNTTTKGCDSGDTICKAGAANDRCCSGNLCNRRNLFKPLKCMTCTSNTTCGAPMGAGPPALVDCPGAGASCFVKIQGRQLIERGCFGSGVVATECIKTGTFCCNRPGCNMQPPQRRKCQTCDDTGATNKCGNKRTAGENHYCMGFKSQCFQKRGGNGHIIKMGCQEKDSKCKQDKHDECCFGDDCNKFQMFKRWPKAGMTTMQLSVSVSVMMPLAVLVKSMAMN